MNDDTLQWIETWLRNRLPGQDFELKEDTDLYSAGLLDSFGIIELIEALEDEYQTLFTEDEMQSGLTRVSDFASILANR